MRERVGYAKIDVKESLYVGFERIQILAPRLHVSALRVGHVSSGQTATGRISDGEIILRNGRSWCKWRLSMLGRFEAENLQVSMPSGPRNQT